MRKVLCWNILCVMIVMTNDVMPNYVMPKIFMLLDSEPLHQPIQFTAGRRPLQLLAISLDLRLLASMSSRPAQIVTPPGLRASYTTFTETRPPVQNSFTLTVVGSTADMASPLPLQHANTVCYVGDFSSFIL
jgi:hypothetical protein